MRFRLSIFLKQFLVIMPLVCIPVALVGYFSIQASVERVNRLVKGEQMSKAEAAAGRINHVLTNCRIDLDTISGLPVLEDFHLARAFRLAAEEQFNQDKLVKLFGEFLARTPYYYQIRYLDQQGREVIKVRRDGEAAPLARVDKQQFFQNARLLPPGGRYVSQLESSRGRRGYLMHWAKPFVSGWRQVAGVVVIDLDFEKIIQILRAVKVGQAGYSFLMDQGGNIIFHPIFPPYMYSYIRPYTPSLKKLTERMMQGDSGWGDYRFQEEEKVAAYAPIPALKWSLAVTIPREEYQRESKAIRGRVIQLVIITLLISLAGAGVLSYSLLKPVKSLVAATNRIANGDLDHEIPVQSHDELGDLTISFNRMVRNLAHIQQELVRSEKLISLGRLSAGVAHEIRNPLNAMKGAMVHLQRRRGDDPLIAEYAGLVSEEIDRLNRFVGEFLYFAKQSPPKFETVEIESLVAGVQRLFEDEAAARGIRFVNQWEEKIPAIKADPYQIEQVLINLVINAMDAQPQGGTIRFETHMVNLNGEPGMTLSITDQGAGIPDKDLASVFDPFFTSKEDGTGLGLPLSLGIVEGHGGSIRLEPASPAGTRVIVELPLRAKGAN